ncbi:peptidylprolyl isomerase [Sphingomonas quercus]|uniref:peptidylprolyl isomerase n=1 Tax=Sphingomonas quercus TaxID=2842451 RepID=A0ABS6BGL8_9SPHN|nr:peptidylprolyl isomerase [Sphingomonas quercus]MBU3077447.1 peptidylprolyl isomerase [Sphingomonas quercus]
MIRRTSVFVLALFALTAAAPPGRAPRVAIETSEGRIVVEVAEKQAPITAGNFLRYVDQKRLDDTNFYRAARNRLGQGLIQGGTRNNDFRRLLPAIPHEPTTKTGLHHVDGTLSMARNTPGTAMGEFFILVGPAPSMDANPRGKGDNAGYAAFGHVVSGMPVVKKILNGRVDPKAGRGAMKGQMLIKPVKIITARRL